MHRCAALLLLTFIPACGPLTFTIGGTPPDAQVIAEPVYADQGMFISDQVALIDVTGLIINSAVPGIFSERENPVGLLHEKLERARLDPNVKAVVLRINSPGGTVTASDAMYREVLRFKQLSGKPVVALCMDVAASGGYYVACAADRIIAYPTSITGSIGVIVQTFSVKSALDRIGVVTTAITSGPNKDVGSPFSHLSPEHRDILEELVDDFYGRFREVVKMTRPAIPDDEFNEVTDGRILSGADALELGLVDANGDLYDAFAAAKKAAGIDKAKLMLYFRDAMFVRNLYTTAHAPAGSPANPGAAGIGTQINLAQINLDRTAIGDATMTFLYLWQP